ncbi:MAG: ribosome recycling factor [Candidatus Yanofskybacteria bacterium RIFCSPHIGHO2_01_FULL_39_8b]|uniref:Ribosome recycling factor n=1 Tax=Candidatus Yanofskybacteria bacterium RIFCSPHIGHO2_01_FULL_39_8b TaxID=1802659 RepID=A0A1F8E7X2_9BACT|nr:MAG: ribosome recycling factor [Candidatus Yanofskybacteria bacterium RIFCSPHIGHO2_01_FULL_39_8b]
MYQDLIKQRKGDFDAVFERARGEVASIRTGRANSAMVEDIQFEYMGSRIRIKELATIMTPEPRMITIQPWDKAAIPLIEKAVRDHGPGLSPSSDSNGVRVNIPPLMEERRKEMLKVLNQKIEEARIKSRQVREDILKKVQAEVKAKTAREDDFRKAKDELQKIMDDFNKKLDELAKKKEMELMG